MSCRCREASYVRRIRLPIMEIKVQLHFALLALLPWTGCVPDERVSRRFQGEYDGGVVSLPQKFGNRREFALSLAKGFPEASEDGAWIFNNSLAKDRYKAVPTFSKGMSFIHIFEHPNRGAAGYGEFYILRSHNSDLSLLNLTDSFELIGICDGSGYEVKRHLGKLIIVTGYPMSFGPHKSVFEWNGSFFEPAK